jgi:hypothetical protein
MTPYWFIFLFPALFALIGDDRKRGTANRFFSLKFDYLWWILIFLFTLIIGLRFQVGGDWLQYLKMFRGSQELSLSSLVIAGDPGYLLLNWMSGALGLGIYGVNLFGGFIFSFGLAVFCHHLPRPFLALTVSIPYLFIVVAMGYTRQGIALGLGMLALVYLARQGMLKFFLLVVLAATMHKSAVLLLPFAVLTAQKNKYAILITMSLLGFGIGFFLVLDVLEGLYTNYIQNPYSSDGALIRLSMNAVPALILLAWEKKFNFKHEEILLWRWFAISSLALFSLFFLTSASAALDRIALYFLPLQLVVFAYLPSVFGTSKFLSRLIVVGVVAYSALVLIVWLNFANHSSFWIPYQNYLFIQESFFEFDRASL